MWIVELRGGRANGRTMKVDYLGCEIVHCICPKMKWSLVRDWEPLSRRVGIFEEHYRLVSADIKAHQAVAYYTGLSRSRALWEARNVRTKS